MSKTLSTWQEHGGRVGADSLRVFFDKANGRYKLYEAEYPSRRHWPVDVPPHLTGHVGNPEARDNLLIFQAQDVNLAFPPDWPERKRRRLSEPGVGYNNQIYLRRTADITSSFRQLSGTASGGSVLHPQISPNGRTVAWAEDAEPWQIRFGPVDAKPSGFATARPGGWLWYETHSFLDDETILFTGSPSAEDLYGTQICEFNLRTGKVRQRTRDKGIVVWNEHAHPDLGGWWRYYVSSRGGAPTWPPRLDLWRWHRWFPRWHWRVTHYNQPGHADYMPRGMTLGDFVFVERKKLLVKTRIGGQPPNLSLLLLR